MVDAELARTTINQNVSRIRRVFRWAASGELIPVTVWQSLTAVNGLQWGRAEAREPEPILPVADSVVDATLPHVPIVIADMIRFQRLTGCRPAEVCLLRIGDIDRSGPVWKFAPSEQ